MVPEFEAFDEAKEQAVENESADQLAKPDGHYLQAVTLVVLDRNASASYLQRLLKIRYNHAAELIERMEREGIVGPANHLGKREVLRKPEGEAA
ncbi:DNA translocase FtsK [Fimbriiglobus ruber]